MAETNPSLAHLLRVLDLKRTGTDQFDGVTEQDEGRLFGGIVLGQTIIAAGRTVERGTIHSMHGYFLRAGRPAKPIAYRVERIRDGRNFTGRRVSAYQDGSDMIFEASFSYTSEEEGFSYQEPMPRAVGPEGQPEWWQTIAPGPDQQRERVRRQWTNPIEIRSGEEGGSRRPIEERLPHRAVWGRPVGELPDDPNVHAAAIAYFSDSGMVATVATVFGMWQPGGATASLDHSIWWHHAPRFDDWLLYSTDSPVARAARGLTWGSMYTRDGVRVVSVAQEGLFRRPAVKP
ncbi:MAG: thioesterase family protein [Dehalococcoidia bacterium]|nr:thioesterase family protein [Dehalococcoidia bacterium]MCB9486668.1 thioesterase family protein [Thermoflexaceae bacterium]